MGQVSRRYQIPLVRTFVIGGQSLQNSVDGRLNCRKKVRFRISPAKCAWAGLKRIIKIPN